MFRQINNTKPEKIESIPVSDKIQFNSKIYFDLKKTTNEILLIAHFSVISVVIYFYHINHKKLENTSN